MGVNPTQTMGGGGGHFFLSVRRPKADEREGGESDLFFLTSKFLGQFSRHRVAVADPGFPKRGGGAGSFHAH